ncbi:MAG: class I SAM-dependent methyltransferase [bacterium]
MRGDPGYQYSDASQNAAHAYLLPVVLSLIDASLPKGRDQRIFEVGCGNGAVANVLTQQGFQVTGVDPSEEGIRQAAQAYPGIQLSIGSTDEDLGAAHGVFPLVLSLEVVEHVYAPRRYASCLFDLLEPGGTAIISTPYHGYFKNLVLAVTGKLDAHFTALWDHGHIKFWSKRTLALLLREAGFEAIKFHLVGRIPPLAKSMIAVARKPG